jgi:hypothetical protein
MTVEGSSTWPAPALGKAILFKAEGVWSNAGLIFGLKMEGRARASLPPTPKGEAKLFLMSGETSEMRLDGN